MLIIANSMKELSFGRLMEVYEEGNLENAAEFFPDAPKNQWLRLAEQEFYNYLQQVFFPTPGAVYLILEEGGRYVSALRLEPYRDGLLLEALETAPNERRKGYAARLIRETLQHLATQGEYKIYSHVSKRNEASLKTHLSCGFQRIMEQAVYADGSVLHSSCTLMLQSGSVDTAAPAC